MLKIVFEFFTVYDQIWCVKVRIRGVTWSDLGEFVRFCVNGGRGVHRRREERDREGQVGKRLETLEFDRIFGLG
jgi:hypothetical protein